MTIRKIYLAAVMILATYSCQDTDSVANVNPDEIFRQTNLFPQPPNQWMGDNNPYYTAGYVGDVMPYYENGTFHLFFLHDAKTKPAGEGFHDIHSFETTNFKDFTYQGRQIPYGTASEPDFGVGTGSLVKVGNTYYYYYTGHNEIASFISSNPRESVLLATSTDMKNWTKIKNFKITAPAGYYDYEFRDPQVFFNAEEGKYWMLVSAQTSAKKAVVLKFTTTNPASGNWTVENPIYTTTSSENYIMLECPDLFKMGNYWYLVFSENWSSNSGTHYRIGTSPNGPWTTPANDRLDELLSLCRENGFRQCQPLCGRLDGQKGPGKQHRRKRLGRKSCNASACSESGWNFGGKTYCCLIIRVRSKCFAFRG
ncbi:family 43 glycosylhydrolase [Chryseobacterium camelliae]|uniref:beta-fructofuranosidase n=1 Tax=Chryseobacterium camelliae TaxID=1265445 RepID=A0ABU0TJZ4_9FLAO|nr:family 43 glycosylhydrolase [Chryseobacterium camelliae]MDQ1096620.1 sucrose-6-phosphate hydrolase SacC (GH32 family) [Chryseobacterium camelliae]